MTIATFERSTDNAPKSKVVTWAKLRTALSKHTIRQDKDAAAWSPAEFKAGGKRQKSDVVSVCCFVLDIDGGLDPHDFCAQWDSLNLTYVCHSTHSSTPEYPKWRAVFPLEDPVDASEWPTVWEKLNMHIGLGLGDTACRDASRLYYLPAVPEGVEPFVFSHDGELLDPDGFADLPKTDYERAKLNGSGRPGDEYEAREDWHEMMTRLGFHSPRRYGRMTVWTRAGKTHGASARTGEGTHGDRMFCWSSSVDGIMAGKLYTKFGLYAEIYHGGDYKAAAAALGKLGYGQQVQTKTGMPRDWGSSDKTIGEMKAEDRAKRWQSVKPIDDYEEEVAEFLVAPYIRASQINLLDAKGGAGKTTLCMALAACGSNGITPITGEKCEPWKTLYFHTEDSPGEMKVVYRECGGQDGGFLIPFTDPMELGEEGLRDLEDMIRHFGAKMVVFDSIAYYMPGQIKAMFDNVAIARLCNGLREVMRRTGCTCLNIRHTKQNTKGLPMSDWGTGGDQWRNSHRSQLVLVRHPNIGRQAAVFHLKASLLSPIAPGFGFSFDQGRFGWLPTVNPTEYGIDESALPGMSQAPTVQRGERGPIPAKLQSAINAFVSVLSSGPKPYGEALDEVNKLANCGKTVVYEARRILGIVYTDNPATLSLPRGFDPFDHPGIDGEGGAKWWAE